MGLAVQIAKSFENYLRKNSRDLANWAHLVEFLFKVPQYESRTRNGNMFETMCSSSLCRSHFKPNHQLVKDQHIKF